ncbi:aminotransferase class V-fold PLP-dependent enzyme [Ruminiclostridium papyrosolvens]|uniref:aminotransferase class V-fold PLP-dependent enzyme n=1 Tax=Ruminiclostridium papyrosolvens TaxID=29362 RepID=UPI0026A09851
MIYLDNSATTPVAQEVFEAMIPYLTTEYGNPSGKYYELAIRAKEAVEQARINVANLINAKPEEIIFTSGATESTNMIIKGVSDYKKYYEKKVTILLRLRLNIRLQ